MTEGNKFFDICIVCALAEEAEAVISEFSAQCQASFYQAFSERNRYEYLYATIQNKLGESLTLCVSWLPGYGKQEMTLHLSQVLEECKPHFAIMTGICAGNARQVQLGDLVVAERTFLYDQFMLDKQKQHFAQHDAMTHPLDVDILHFLKLFDEWKTLVARLERPASVSKEQVRGEVSCHIRPMASGSAVCTGNPFEEVRVPIQGAIAIDMEGAAFSRVMERYPMTSWLIVKGVCDYADQGKSDTYHTYAAHASALYALSFIQSYVTRERFPNVDWEKAHIFTLLRRIEREAKECATQLDLPEQAGYDILAVIYGQAFLGAREVPQMETVSQSSGLESSSQPDLSISGQEAELPPDDVLIKNIQSGKDDDFSVFHERYYQKLVAYARSHGYRDDEVEDLVQDTFVRAFHSLKKPHSSDVCNPRVWLLRIANQVMHERAASAMELDENVLSEVVPDGNVLEETILEKMQALPPQYREILELLLQGYTYEEIASRLGSPLTTVRAYLSRGLKLLRQWLASKDIDPPQACS